MYATAPAAARIDAQFPSKIFHTFYETLKDGSPVLAPDGQPKHRASRYKILYGGRGAGRSWGVARWAVIEAARRPLQFLCGRELQHSIQDSVHKLLVQQIDKLGLGHLYDVQQAVIRSACGSEFRFEGIRHNITKIKSYEGVDYCWVEEANAVSANSWDVLIPTVRKPGSEIIATFNPDLETDATYERFVKNPPPNCIAVFMTWRDNPWFAETELPAERDALKARNYDSYLHVWEGQCKRNLEGSVYADELREAAVQERICKVPYDRAVPVNTYWDLGRSDHTSIWFVQQVGYEYRIIDFYESRLKHIDHYLKVLQDRSYLYGTHWLPHDARAKQLGMKMTIEEQARAKLQTVRIVQKVSEKDLINAARTVFPQCYFDAARCAEGIHHLRHYRYDIDSQTKQFSQHPLHDEHSDASKAFEYFGVASKMPSQRRRLALPGMASVIGAIAGAFGEPEDHTGVPYAGEAARANTRWLGH
jgi:phage terminase large subunit